MTKQRVTEKCQRTQNEKYKLYNTPTCLMCTNQISKFFVTQVEVSGKLGAKTKSLPLNTTLLAVNIFQPKTF